MRGIIMLVCAAALLAGCSTDAAKQKQAKALYTAIYDGNKEKAKQLLHQTDVQELPVLEDTPPQLLAAENGRTDIVKELVERGASVKVKDRDGVTMLHAAAANGDRELAAYVLKHGAAINEKDGNGWTPLLRSLTPTNAKPDRTEDVAWLLGQGAKADTVTKTGWTALHEAVYQNQPGAVRQLLTVSGHINHADRDGTVPLLLAVRSGNLEMVRLLIEAGSDVQKQDGLGNTALHYAVSYNLEPIAAYLLQHGAVPAVRNQDGQTCIDIAKQRGHAAVLRLLQK